MKAGGENTLLCASPPHLSKGGGQLPCTFSLFSEKMKARDLELIHYISLNFKFRNLMGNHEISSFSELQ